MIRFDRVSKHYHTSRGRRTVLRNVSHDFLPGRHTALMGVNGAGKSTFLRLLSGAENADSGRIERSGSVSWPLGFRGGLHGRMNGREIIAFVARVYGQDYRRMLAFVEEFSELGEFLREEIRTYSTGMKARLSFGISMAMEFQYYLVDEVIAVGDQRFKKKCRAALIEKMESSTIVFVSHNDRVLSDFCNTGIVLKDGDLYSFEALPDAIAFYKDSLAPMT